MRNTTVDLVFKSANQGAIINSRQPTLSVLTVGKLGQGVKPPGHGVGTPTGVVRPESCVPIASLCFRLDGSVGFHLTCDGLMAGCITTHPARRSISSLVLIVY